MSKASSSAIGDVRWRWDIEVVRDDFGTAVPGEFRGVVAARGRHARAQRGIADQSRDAAADAGNVGVVEQQPGDAIDDDLRDRVDPRRDAWQAAGGGFEQHEAKALGTESVPGRGVDEQIGPLIQRADLIPGYFAEDANVRIDLT